MVGCRGSSRGFQMAAQGLAALLLLMVAMAQAFDMDMMGGMPKPEQKKAPAVKEDIPYIRCQVCEAVVKQSIKLVKDLTAELKPGKKLQEADIIDKLEKVCDPDRPAGEWITHYDLQEDGDQLKMVDMGQPGECESECRTIARACEQFTENLDLSDFSEQLYKGKKRAALNQWACWDNSKACSKKAPPLPASRPAGPKFVPLDAEKAKRDAMMRNMKEAGLKGTMYDRESILNSMAGMKGEGEDDDDDSSELPPPLLSGGDEL